MQQTGDIRAIQNRILETMKYIDELCRKHGIVYYIMGGTALGAVRHGGFIHWDDDLDIFMTPGEYKRFQAAFAQENSPDYVLQEWRTTPDYLEYAKVRRNHTTFIEENLKHERQMHHGIYVDIMILHKVPENRLIQRLVYLKSKYVTFYGLSQRNWKPKNRMQKTALKVLKLLPNRWLAKRCYRHIYRYDERSENYCYCYWITKANFRQGLFSKEFFNTAVDIRFEDSYLLGPECIQEYLAYRYGNYMKLPPESERAAAVHAYIADADRDYSEYFSKGSL